jgi:hypothetical protein
MLYRISPNVVVFTNPRGLKERSDWVEDLASQGCLPESASSKSLWQTKGRKARSLNTVLYDVALPRIGPRNRPSSLYLSVFMVSIFFKIGL